MIIEITKRKINGSEISKNKYVIIINRIIK